MKNIFLWKSIFMVVLTTAIIYSCLQFNNICLSSTCSKLSAYIDKKSSIADHNSLALEITEPLLNIPNNFRNNPKTQNIGHYPRIASALSEVKNSSQKHTKHRKGYVRNLPLFLQIRQLLI